MRRKNHKNRILLGLIASVLITVTQSFFINCDARNNVSGIYSISFPENNMICQDTTKIEKPKFNGGGDEVFMKWVWENLRYPIEALSGRDVGTVYVAFVVDEEGEVRDIKIVRGVSLALDQEVHRVISQSPKWTPGKDSKGEVMEFNLIYPVTFNMVVDGQKVKPKKKK